MTWFVVKVARALKHRPQFLLFKLLPLCRHQVRGIDTCHGQQQTQPHHQHSHILAAASTLISAQQAANSHRDVADDNGGRGVPAVSASVARKLLIFTPVEAE